MIRDFRDKLCVVTGGSSGIGLAIAKALAREGARLLLVARHERALALAAEQLAQLGAAQAGWLAADVASDAAVAALGRAIARHGEAADLVVNCAGIVSAGVIGDVPLEEWRRLHDVNVLGVVRVLNVALPGMLARARAGRGGGHVVNVASGAGLVGFPGLGAYGSTKAAVVGLSESLRGELAGAGIGVTAVCPGFVKTPIAHKLALFGRMDNERTRKAVASWFERNNLAAATVARRTLDAVRRNRALVVVGKDAASGYWTKRLLPGVLDRMMARMSRTQVRRQAAG